MSLLTDIDKLYDHLGSHPVHGHLGPLHPFVGAAYQEPVPDALRVLAIGINSYVGPDHPVSRPTCPNWFRGWMADGAHRFYRGVASECGVIAEALTDSPDFAGLRYRGLGSIYLTNAVKRFLPAAQGAKAADVDPRFHREGARVWRQELELLAEYGVLPHVIVVLGEAGWKASWSALGREPRAAWVEDYVPCSPSSPMRHRLNRVVVQEDGKTRLMLLVRVAHPASANKTWSAARLVAHPEFQQHAEGGGT